MFKYARIVTSAIILAIIMLSGCSDNKPKEPIEVWRKYKKQLIRQDFYENERIKSWRTYTLDTIATGAQISFYQNGRPSLWAWIKKNEQQPQCIFGFDTSGQVDSIIGRPFLNVALMDSLVYLVEIAMPPGTKPVVTMTRYKNDKVIDDLLYEPTVNDSTGTILVGLAKEVIPAPDKAFILRYYITDDSGYAVAGSNIGISLLKGKVAFVPVDVSSDIGVMMKAGR